MAGHVHRLIGEQWHQHLQVLTQMADRVRIIEAEAGFDNRLVAEPDAKREPVRAELLDGECLLRKRRRMSRKGGTT
ncbi:MAG TPA: hypothetical protein VF874_06000 [Mycobacterium sp.]